MNFNIEKTLLDGEFYEIAGLNIWNFKWTETGKQFSISTHHLPIFSIYTESKQISFAAIEVSNGVWLIGHD